MDEIKDKISIVTICYNCKEDLEKTIKSVVSQTYPNIEYIIIDGGSSDGTLGVLEEYKEHFAFCVSEPDDGVYDAMNKGIRHCTGEWILCLNAGDVLYDEAVLSKIFEKKISDDISFIYSNVTVYHENGDDELLVANRHNGDVHHQNAIYRRNLHARYGYYIVTHPYIISDLLFFLAVPEEMYQKTDILISKIKYGGISCQPGCAEQVSAAKVIYGYDTIPHIFYMYVRLHFSLFRKNVKDRINRLLRLS